MSRVVSFEVHFSQSNTQSSKLKSRSKLIFELDISVSQACQFVIVNLCYRMQEERLSHK